MHKRMKCTRIMFLKNNKYNNKLIRFSIKKFCWFCENLFTWISIFLNYLWNKVLGICQKYVESKKSIPLWYVKSLAERSCLSNFRKAIYSYFYLHHYFQEKQFVFKIVGYLKERGFDEEVLRKVRESQVSYFVSLYNVTISFSILALLKNRSTSSGEDGRAGDFSDERSFIEGAIWHLNLYGFI